MIATVPPAPSRLDDELEAPRPIDSTRTTGMTIRYTANVVMKLSSTLAATRRHRPA